MKNTVTVAPVTEKPSTASRKSTSLTVRVPSRFLPVIATFVVFAWRDKSEYKIPASTVARIDRVHRLAQHGLTPSLQPAE